MPWESVDHIHENDEAPLFYNPATTFMISKILNDDKVVIKIIDDTWYVWYPLERLINLEEVNDVLAFFDIEFKALNLDNDFKLSTTIDEIEVLEETITMINEHSINLKNRLSLTTQRPIDNAIVLNDD